MIWFLRQRWDAQQHLLRIQVERLTIDREARNAIRQNTGRRMKDVNPMIYGEAWIECQPQQPILRPGENVQLSNLSRLLRQRVPYLHRAMMFSKIDASVLGNRELNRLRQILGKNDLAKLG